MSGPRTVSSIPILVVEDNEADLRLIREAVQDGPLRYEVHSAHDGQEAMQYLHAGEDLAGAPRPRFILLDLNMPRKSGPEVLAELRREEGLRSIPVIVMTSAPVESVGWVCTRGGAAELFRKPSSYADLRGILRRLDRYAGTAPGATEAGASNG